MIHTAVGATIACAAIGFIIWTIFGALLRLQFYSGRRAFFEDQPVDPRWPELKRRGWWQAWGEHKRSKLGLRG